jgi:hypothetical protein
MSDQRGKIIYAIILLIPFLLGMWRVSDASSIAYNSSLVAHWRFDEGVGYEVLDSTKNHNTGILINTQWSNHSISGKALKFNGKDSSVFIEDSDSLDANEGLSILVWIKSSSFFGNGNQSGNPIVVKWQNNNIGQYHLTAFSNGSLAFRISNFTMSDILVVKDVLSLDSWYNIAAVWDQELMAIYINGTLMAEKLTNISKLYSKEYLEDYVQLGADKGGNDPYWRFNGWIDELSIFNSSLSKNEIIYLMTISKSYLDISSESLDIIMSRPISMRITFSFSFPLIFSILAILLKQKKKKH